MAININDEDLDPEATKGYTGQKGFTQMTFAFCLHSIADTARCLDCTPPGGSGTALAAI
jgi:hypothetical protein